MIMSRFSSGQAASSSDVDPHAVRVRVSAAAALMPRSAEVSFIRKTSGKTRGTTTIGPRDGEQLPMVLRRVKLIACRCHSREYLFSCCVAGGQEMSAAVRQYPSTGSSYALTPRKGFFTRLLDQGATPRS